MLSIGEQQIVNIVLRICCTTCLFPIHWDSETNRMTVTKSRFKLLFVCCSCALLQIYTVFLVIRLKTAYETSITTDITFELVVHFFWIPVNFTCSIIQLFSIRYRYEFATLFNQLYSFNAGKGKEYFGSEWRDRGSGINEYVLSFFMFCLTFEVVFFWVFYLLYPQNKNYLYSVLADYGPMAYFGCLVLETFVTPRAGFSGAFYVIMGFNYVWSLNFWIKKACTEWVLDPKVDDWESIRVYRVLTYLSTLYNQSISRTCVPAMKTCIESLGILMLFGTLRLYENVDNLLYAMFPVGAVLFLSQSMMVIALMAGAHEGSSQYMHNFQLQLHNKTAQEGKFLRRVILSCRPIQCRIGTPYFVERETKIKYAGILLDVLLSLLLGTKKHRHSSKTKT